VYVSGKMILFETIPGMEMGGIKESSGEGKFK
jgi:hypothetical protein